ncbi:MAG: flagellar basal body-associated FliL family protein [Bacteroidota bacterium]
MAELDQPDPEVGGDNGATVEGGDAPKKRKFPFALLLIPALLLPAGGAAWLVYSRYEQVAEAASAVARIFGTSTPRSTPDAEEPIEYGVFHELEAITVNPAGSTGKRFLMVELGLEASDGKVFEQLETKEIVVRDTVLGVLSSYSVDQLSDIALRAQMRTDLLQAINSILDEEEQIQRLYFTQYVVQ